jgi:ferric-dicitrate binding protein FerR (iron transport regulator)
MSEREQRTPDEQAVQALLRSVPAPAPSMEFRGRLRVDWMAERRRPAHVVPLVQAGFALAVAAVLAGVFFVANRGPVWELAGVTGEGRIVVGERVVPAAEAAVTLPELLRPGATIQVDAETQIDVAAPEVLVMQMAPGSELTIPGSPGRWLGRSISGGVPDGEVRFVTGPQFEGVHLTIEAPAARIHAAGTTFAVIASAESTCVCVLEGEVRMEARGRHAEPVAAGMRRTVFAHRDEVLDEEIFPMERMKLEMLRDQVRGEAPRGP